MAVALKCGRCIGASAGSTSPSRSSVPTSTAARGAGGRTCGWMHITYVARTLTASPTWPSTQPTFVACASAVTPGRGHGTTHGRGDQAGDASSLVQARSPALMVAPTTRRATRHLAHGSADVLRRRCPVSNASGGRCGRGSRRRLRGTVSERRQRRGVGRRRTPRPSEFFYGNAFVVARATWPVSHKPDFAFHLHAQLLRRLGNEPPR
jgi:hypothetical protein